MTRARSIADIGDDVAAGGSLVTTESPSLGRRNLIINGAMQVAQRGTSTFTLPSSAAYGLTDRWNFQNVSGGTVTVDLSTDVPSGFKNSMKFTVTTADTDGLASTDRCMFNHRIEGQNMVQLAQGTADATGFTMSFWVKSSVTGTFGGAFANTAVNYSYPFEYTINSADTWEYKTILVSGATTGTWATDNTIGMFVWFSLGMGSNRTGTAGSWQSGDFRGTTGTVNLVENAGATFYITGVQLEVGSVATPFEHRSFGEELAACQRYFYRSKGTGAFTAHGMGANFDGDSSDVFIHYPVEMRANPDVTFSGTVSIHRGSGTNANISNMGDAGGSRTTSFIRCDHSNILSTGDAVYCINNNDASGEISFNAEL